MRSIIALLCFAVAATLAQKCPTSNMCRPDEKSCPMGLPGPDGCPAPTMCIPAKTPSSKSGMGMCDNPCPSNCDAGGKGMSCPQGEDYMGCKQADLCYPAPDPKDKCPKSCPTVCGPNDMLCMGKSWGKCPGSGYCMPKGKKVMIEYECPGFCPVDCGLNEIQCRQVDSKGCDLPAQCIPAMTANKNGSPTCPNFCPSPACKDNEMLCPGMSDSNGCKGPDTCVPRMMGNDNRLCPAACPMTCRDGEMPCSSTDMYGCPTPTICIPYNVPSPSGNWTCSNSCPLYCPKDSIQCSGQVDAKGCKAMDFCIPIKYGNNNAPCPTSCPMNCQNGTFECPYTFDSNGCQMPSMCVSDWKKCNIKG